MPFFRLLTADQESAVRRVFAAGGTTQEAAVAAGVSSRLIQTRFADQLADVVLVRKSCAIRRAACDPTEAEIARLKREIRAGKGELPPSESLPTRTEQTR